MKTTVKQKKVSVKTQNAKRADIKKFVTDFYKRYGKAMSKLANE